MQVNCLENTQSGMLDLQHLLPKSVTHYSQVPKTVIYMDTIAQICQGVELFRKWMRQLAYPPGSARWVSPYFADMAEDDKTRVDEQFERLAEDLTEPRILFASDAFGLGVDNKDIARVVQFQLPKTIQSLIQRMGRVMRCGTAQGRFLFLYPPWCLGPKAGSTLQPLQPGEDGSADENNDPSSRDADGGKGDVSGADEATVNGITSQSGRKTDGERRRDMDAGLYDIINGTGRLGDCIRLRALRFFADATYDGEGVDRPTPCCSECHADFRSSIEPHAELQPPSVHGCSVHVPWYRAKLQAWRAAKAVEACAGCRFGVEPSIVMTDEYMDATVRYGTQIKELSDLARWAGAWANLDRYGPDVLAILDEGRTQSLYSSEVASVWRETKGKRRKKDDVAAAPSNDELQAQRKDAWLIKKGFKPQVQVTNRKGRRSSPQPAKGKGKSLKPARSENAGPASQASSNQGVVDIRPSQHSNGVGSVEGPAEGDVGDNAAVQPGSPLQASAQSTREKARKRKRALTLNRQPLASMDTNAAISTPESQKGVSFSSRGRKITHSKLRGPT